MKIISNIINSPTGVNPVTKAAAIGSLAEAGKVFNQFAAVLNTLAADDSGILYENINHCILTVFEVLIHLLLILW